MNFKTLDFFGPSFGFSFDEKKNFQTHFGGILSLIFSITSIIIVGGMSISFFDRSSPIIIQQNAKYSSAPKINFTNKFKFSIRMTIGNQSLFTNLDKVKIELNYNYVYKSNYRNITTTKLSLNHCNPQNFPDHQQYFHQYLLNESLCPEIENRFIEGDFLSDEMYYFQVRFHMCENSSVNSLSDGVITCKSEAEIKEFLSNNLVKAHLFFTNTYYNDKNYYSPEINYIDNYNINIYFDSQRETHFYLENSYMYSDDSYFFLSPYSRLFSKIAFSFVSERAASRERQMSDFVLINIKASKSSTNISRMFRSFTDLVADIGGILNFMMIFFSKSLSLYSTIEFYVRILRPSMYLYLNTSSLSMNDESKLKNHLGKKFFEESRSNINIIHNSRYNAGYIKEVTSFENLNINSKKLNSEIKLDLEDCSVKTPSKKEIGNIEKFRILSYDHKKSFILKIAICFCPCLMKCNKKIIKDMDLFEFSMKKYDKLYDIFYFIEKFGEFSLISNLLLKKEEKEMVDLVKNLIFIKNEDFLLTIQSHNKLNLKKNAKDDLKKKSSLIEQEDKLKKFLNNIAIKEDKSVFEENFKKIFDSIHLNDIYL